MLHTHPFLVPYHTVRYAPEVLAGRCLCVMGTEYSGVPCLPASPPLHGQGHHVGSLESLHHRNGQMPLIRAAAAESWSLNTFQAPL